MPQSLQVTAALNAAAAMIQTVRAITRARGDRSLVIGGYIGSCVETLRLPSMLASTEVRSWMPSEVLRALGHPLVCFAYHQPLQMHVCNWSAASKAVGDGVRECICRQPRFAPFCHAQTGHVITKDLTLVENAELRELMSRGPGFRMRPVDAWKPSSDDGKPVELWEYVVHMVECALEKYVKMVEEELGVAPMTMEPWQQTILDKVTTVAKTLTTEQLAELQKWLPEHVGWSVEAANEAVWLKKHFVIAPADKDGQV